MLADSRSRRSPWPVVALVAGAAVVVYLAAAVLSFTAPRFGLPFATGSGPTHTLDRTAPVGVLESAELQLGYGASHISIASGDTGADLYRAHFEYTDNVQPTAALDSTKGLVTVGIHNRPAVCFFGCNQQATLRLTLNDRLPWKLSLSGGASDGRLDLRW